MKRHLEWQVVSREQLSAHLERAEITQAQNLSGCNLYRCQLDGHESLALSLPDGSGLVIEQNRPHNPWLERRRRGKSAAEVLPKSTELELAVTAPGAETKGQ